MYSFAHKVISEAQALLLKAKFDPDQTAQNYLMQQNHKLKSGSEYMALSDKDQSSNSSDDSSDNESSIEEPDDISIYEPDFSSDKNEEQ